MDSISKFAMSTPSSLKASRTCLRTAPTNCILPSLSAEASAPSAGPAESAATEASRTAALAASPTAEPAG
eukprot:5917244-Lingulodinium_polyedra.AAC.1